MFLRNLSKSLTKSWLKLCNKFSNFSPNRDNVLNTSVPGQRTLTNGITDAAAGEAVKATGCDHPWINVSNRPDATVVLSPFTTPNTKTVCATAPLAKVIEDVSIPAEGQLKVTESSSKLRL